MSSNYLTIQHSKIHYTTTGNGPAVILLHGFGEDSSIWSLQIKTLQLKYQVITIDLPGFGLSAPLSKEVLSLEDIADVVDQVISSMPIKKLIMIGHSLGGYVSLSYLKKFPKKVEALGLFHSSIFADNEDKIGARNRSIDFIQKNGSEPFWETSISGLFKEIACNEKNIQQIIENARSISMATIIKYYQAMMKRESAIEVLQMNNIPYLFIIGKYDQAVLFKDSIRQINVANESHVHILQSSSHMGMFEEPAKCTEILMSFCGHVFNNHQKLLEIIG